MLSSLVASLKALQLGFTLKENSVIQRSLPWKLNVKIVMNSVPKLA